MGESTASCEGEINKIKNIVFKDIKNKTIRVDSFVQRHIEHLFGEMLLTDSNSEVDHYELDKTSLCESQNLQKRENWKGKVVKKCSKLVPKIDFNDSCNMTFNDDDDKENINDDDDKENIDDDVDDEKSIEEEKSEISTSSIKYLKNEENEKNTLKDISNKLCTKKRLPLYMEHQKDRIAQKLQYKQSIEVGVFKHCSNIRLAANKINGISYSLLNSCPFDSIIQSLFVIGIDDELIKKMVDI